MPRNVEIVVYCGGPKCPQIRIAAEELVKLGYENVHAREGGLEWKAVRLDRRRGITYGIMGSLGGPLNMFWDVRPSALKRRRDRRRSR